MSNNDGVQTMTVSDLCNNNHYLIPIYQRSYAWGIPETTVLIDDIWDSCSKNDKNPYYIGSLVVSKRKDGKFEVVDGQQRLTTLKILLAALKIDESINLEFESREVSTKTLMNLEKENGSVVIQQVYKHCKKLVENGKSIRWGKFKDYLLKQVTIIRTILPEKTDLNHYFEIMNNRGEQLEKHEILKARFMGALSNEQDKTTFAKIWDACSQMDGYVLKHFSADDRKALFGSELNTFPESFECVNAALKDPEGIEEDSGTKTSTDTLTIEELLSNASFHTIEQGDGITEESYASIVQFPNFLLHVLRVFLKTQEEDKSKDVVLDDKRLLEAFDKDTETTVIKVDNAKGFAYTLLKCRFLFDRYVIKSHAKDKWTLRSVIYDKNEKSMYEKNTFSEEMYEKNVMVQAMFHVSYPTQNYKYWLDALLTHLHKQKIIPHTGDGFLGFMEELSDRFFFGRFGEDEEKSYDNILEESKLLNKEVDEKKYFHTGTAVHNFIFNRLDYLLWKSVKLNACPTYCEYITAKQADAFHFTFRSSVEHFYPQNPKSGDELDDAVLNHFGNLCLISASKNSELSNYSPASKKEHYDKVSTDSLKQQLMMIKSKSWNKDEIEEHGKQMLKILCQSVHKEGVKTKGKSLVI